MGDALPTLDRFALAVAHLPGAVDGGRAGDAWYDVTAIADGHLAIVGGAHRRSRRGNRAAGQRRPSPPLVRRAAQVAPVLAPGTLLGVYADIELTEVTVRLEHGDMMVLYTDGVTEARGVDGFYGGQRLTRVVRSSPASADAVADNLLGDVIAFQQHRLRDDVAVLVVEATP